ncbi:MAG: hypothetical protein D6722_26165, partial [Bacteroidetes bacterium]
MYGPSRSSVPSKPTFLYIETDLEMARQVQQNLHHHGFKLLVATGEQEGQNLASQVPLQGILIGQKLRGQSVLALGATFHQAFPKLPLLLLASSLEGDMVKQAIQAGFSDFLFFDPAAPFCQALPARLRA